LLGLEPIRPASAVPSPIVAGTVVPAVSGEGSPRPAAPVAQFHIPEPGSIILVVTGMIGLVARRHLRRQIMAAD